MACNTCFSDIFRVDVDSNDIFTHVIQFDLIDMRSSLAGRVPTTQPGLESFQSDRGSSQTERSFEVDNGPSQTTKVLVWLAWGPVRPIWGSLYSTSRPSLLTAALSNGLLFQVERCGPEKFRKKHFKKCFKNARGVHVAIKGSVATPAPPPLWCRSC